MNSMMPKSGQAPTSPNAMPGGLGAILQQPGAAPKGASSKNMQQVVDIARKMSDMQLSDVLAGKSLDVPQYVAMTEAMGRKSLRTAMQGAQAQQQKQPSVKDRLMAEEAAAQMPAVDTMGNVTGYAGGGAIDMNESSGIAGLPASNMDSMDMASGGIVAFQNTGLVEDEDKGYYQRMKERLLKASESSTTSPGMPTLFGIPLFGAADKKALAKENAPAIVQADALPPVDTGSKPDDKGRHIANIDTPPAAPTKGDGKSPGITALAPDSYEDLQKKRSSDYLNKLEGLSEKQRAGIAQIKKEGSGEALMQLGSA